MNSRISFGKVLDRVPLPQLIENQVKSFNSYINGGISDTFKSIFPIEDHNGTYELHYISSEMGVPNITPEEAIEKDVTYAAPLRAVFRLHNKTTDTHIEKEVFMGMMPYMTDDGAFISNGNERVIVTQIVRSPGVYYESNRNKKGEYNYQAKIIPTDGAWITFEINQKGIVEAKIDKGKKVPVTIFFKALGLGGNEEILRVFDNNSYIVNTLEKDTTTTEDEALRELFKKIRPNDPPSLDRARTFIGTLFSDISKYNLADVGRFKINNKLDIRNRVLKRELAFDTGSYPAGTKITEAVLQEIGEEEVFIRNREGDPIKVIGNGMPQVNTLSVQDFVAIINYLVNLNEGIGATDNIDHLANRRLRLVGELLKKQFQTGMARVKRVVTERMTVNSINVDQTKDQLTPQQLIHIRPLTAAMREFLGSGQLSQYVDQINPLAELANKRRTSALGPGGLQKERASMEARDVHHSHYGKICPIETPEGFGVGLINALASYCRINDYGFFETPFVKVDEKKHRLSDEIHYMTADVEERYYIAEAREVDKEGNFKSDYVSVRYGEEYLTVKKEEVDYVDVSTKQIVGISAALIPFLEYDDANRAVMGSNMQRQGVPLLNPQEPIVGTGVEHAVAVNTKSSYVAEDDGVVKDITDTEIIVSYKNLGDKVYRKRKFIRTNADTCFNHYVKVYKGQKLKKGDVIADGMSSKNGEIALGRNVLVAFMPWNGYNYEDAIVLSDKLVKTDAFTTISIKEFSIDVRSTRMGNEVLTNEVPGVKDDDLAHLDEDGIIRVGTEVKGGDILVGKITPRSQEDKSAEEKLLEAIFGEKAKEYKDNSLRLDNGKSGKVVNVIRLTKDNGAELNNDVIETVKVQVADIRPIRQGDKMAGRHGNKGVISIVLPEADMPFLPDGTTAEICLNPLGVPSRMNIGQVMETHLGMVGRALGLKFETPVFDGATKNEIQEQIRKAGFPENGKFEMYDGRTGRKFENAVTLGTMYMLKLNHQVKDKLHARSTGPYSLVTQQPLGGKAQMGGQRLGEMEVWALQAHGAAYTLQEMMTYKSDDTYGRTRAYEAIVKKENFPSPGIPEAVKVLISQLRGLNMDIKLSDKEGNDIMVKRRRHEI